MSTFEVHTLTSNARHASDSIHYIQSLFTKPTSEAVTSATVVSFGGLKHLCRVTLKYTYRAATAVGRTYDP